MSKRQDEIAAKAVRKSTLRSLKEKKAARLQQLKNDYELKVQEINIQYAEDPERLKAKYASANFAKSEKAKKKAELKIEKEKKEIELQKSIRKYGIGEEIASSIVQGIGCCLFIAATAILETIAISKATTFITLTTVMYALFGGSMILMYLFSILHHALKGITGKEVFNRLSHVFSYLIIAFGYTVYSITKIQGTFGWILYGVVVALALVGAITYAICGTKSETFSIIFYFVSGWAGIVACRLLYRALPAQSFKMLILASIFYLIGLIFYALRKIKYMHFIGNIFMLIGSIYIFFSLFFINL